MTNHRQILQKAIRLVDVGKYLEAQDLLNRCIRLCGSDDDVLTKIKAAYTLASSYYTQGKFDDSIEWLEFALDVHASSDTIAGQEDNIEFELDRCHKLLSKSKQGAGHPEK